ncbi:MAG: HDIG domain-containing metalloprotein [Myxococcota bacterium]
MLLRTRIRVSFASSVVLSVLLAGCLLVAATAVRAIPEAALVVDRAAPVTVRLPGIWSVTPAAQPGVFDEIAYRRLVVPRGTVISGDDPGHRLAMAWDGQRRPLDWPPLAALGTLYFFAALALSAHMRRYGHPRFRLFRSQVGVLLSFVVMLLGMQAFGLLAAPPLLWFPLSAFGLWISLGFERRTAAAFEVFSALVVASFFEFDVLLFLALAVRGSAMALLFRQRRRQPRLVVAGVVGAIFGAGAVATMLLLRGGPAVVVADVKAGLDSLILAGGGGAFLSGLIASALSEPVMAVFGHVTRRRLVNLSDIEQPLLKKMATEAPGSWAHARAMANLAEGAAAAIEADPLLIRVGAYYHDLGKTVQSEYFIENLPAGTTSPHDGLAPEVSADAIMAHVVLGTKILREGGIPEPIIEFAYTHHGTQVVEYFWNKYREAHQDDEGGAALEEGHFRYPGMKPLSKETGILMLVDAIEAASRTVEPPTHAKFEEMIRRIVFHKLKSGQLAESGLTLEDLRLITTKMADTLVSMYHGRIKYPWQKEKEREERAEAEARAKADEERDTAVRISAVSSRDERVAVEEDPPTEESFERAGTVSVRVDRDPAPIDLTEVVDPPTQVAAPRRRRVPTSKKPPPRATQLGPPPMGGRRRKAASDD